MPKGSAILCISLMQSVCYIRLPSFRDLTCSGLSITITLDSIIKSTESKVRRFYRVAKHEILTRNMPRKSIVGNTGCFKQLFFAFIGNYWQLFGKVHYDSIKYRVSHKRHQTVKIFKVDILLSLPSLSLICYFFNIFADPET